MGPLRVVIAGDHCAPLRDVLERAGIRVVAQAETEDKALTLVAERDAAAIVHAGTPDVECGDDVPTIVVGDDADLAASASLGAFAAMPFGCTDAQLAAAVDVAVARWTELRAARAEAASLRDQLESRKLVERAKGILMARLRVSEDEAYKRLQRASQDENRKMRDIAESIIHTEKILGIAAQHPEQDRSTG
jgi:two-component system, response regulator PdtaR